MSAARKDPKESSPRRAQGELTLDGRRYWRGEATFDPLAARLSPFLRQEFRKKKPLPKGCSVDDLVQLTMLKIWKSFDQFRDDDTTSLSKWATTVAHSVLTDAARKKVHVQAPAESDPDAGAREEGPGPRTRALVKDLAGRVEQCFVVLSVEEEQVFRMHILEDIQHKEIASRLGCSEGTSRSHLSRGLAKLAAEVRNRGID